MSSRLRDIKPPHEGGMSSPQRQDSWQSERRGFDHTPPLASRRSVSITKAREIRDSNYSRGSRADVTSSFIGRYPSKEHHYPPPLSPLLQGGRHDGFYSRRSTSVNNSREPYPQSVRIQEFPRYYAREDDLDRLDTLKNADIVKQIQDYIRQNVEEDFKLQMETARMKEEEDRAKLELLQRKIEESIKRKMDAERQAAEDAERRTIAERSRIEKEMKERIDAENTEAARTKETEMRRIEEFARLAQEKLKQSMDEIVALTRDKILEDLGRRLPDRGGLEFTEQVPWPVETVADMGPEGLGRREANHRPAEQAEATATPSSQRFADVTRHPSNATTPGMPPPPIGRQHHRFSRSQSSGYSKYHHRQPPEAPEPPSADARYEIESHMTGNSSSRASSIGTSSSNEGSDDDERSSKSTVTSSRLNRQSSRQRRSRRHNYMDTHERRMRKTLRILREELIGPITEALAPEMFETAYMHPTAPSSYPQSSQYPSEAGGQSVESSYEHSESYPPKRKTGDGATVSSQDYTWIPPQAQFQSQEQGQNGEVQPSPQTIPRKSRKRRKRESPSLPSDCSEPSHDNGTIAPSSERSIIKREQSPMAVAAVLKTTTEIKLKNVNNSDKSTKESANGDENATIIVGKAGYFEEKMTRAMMYVYRAALACILNITQLLIYYIYSLKDGI